MRGVSEHAVFLSCADRYQGRSVFPAERPLQPTPHTELSLFSLPATLFLSPPSLALKDHQCTPVSPALQDERKYLFVPTTKFLHPPPQLISNRPPFPLSVGCIPATRIFHLLLLTTAPLMCDVEILHVALSSVRFDESAGFTRSLNTSNTSVYLLLNFLLFK